MTPNPAVIMHESPHDHVGNAGDAVFATPSLTSIRPDRAEAGHELIVRESSTPTTTAGAGRRP